MAINYFLKCLLEFGNWQLAGEKKDEGALCQVRDGPQRTPDLLSFLQRLAGPDSVLGLCYSP